MRTPLRLRFVLAAAALLCVSHVHAQNDYPVRPIRIVVPYEPGGGTDKLARTLSQRLGERLGQPVIVENKAGAATNLGTVAVAAAKPDGYTLLMAGTPLAINQSLFKTPPVDLKALQPITLVAITPNVLLVHPSVPVKTLSELVTYSKAHPGKLYYASPGVGSSPHLAGEMLKIATGMDMTHVPYKGSSQGMADVLEGRVQLTFATMLSGVPYVNSGQLRALAITPKRSSALPGVPSFEESGLAGFDVAGWYGLLAPAGTPEAIIAKLNKESTAILHDPEIVRQFASEGIEIEGTSEQKFAAFLSDQVAKFRSAVKQSGATAD
jgi:tripartite-type tricarboxylate transporter receptor subunit TctC